MKKKFLNSHVSPSCIWNSLIVKKYWISLRWQNLLKKKVEKIILVFILKNKTSKRAPKTLLRHVKLSSNLSLKSRKFFWRILFCRLHWKFSPLIFGWSQEIILPLLLFWPNLILFGMITLKYRNSFLNWLFIIWIPLKHLFGDKKGRKYENISSYFS